MSDNYVFPGFRKPTFTQVSDEVLDELMPRLSGSEFKVLMYSCGARLASRKTPTR